MPGHHHDPQELAPLEDELKKQLERLRDEATPDRLLDLARELEALLREGPKTDDTV